MSVALTTTFTPRPQCTLVPWLMTHDQSRGLYYGLLGGAEYSSCLPASFTPDPAFFYSPGIYCPAGYSTACSSTQVIGPETATIATCCPSGYNCQSRSQTGAWPWEYTLGCTSACQSTQALTYTDASRLITSECFDGGGMNAYSVQLRFRSADLITTSSKFSKDSAPVTAATISIPTTNAPTVTASSLSSNDDNFSTGAKAGIGVGSVLGIALVAAICWLAWTLHKKSTHKHAYENHDQSELVNQRPIPYDPHNSTSAAFHDGSSYYQPQHKFDQVQITYEAHSSLSPQRHELPANT